ncbi:hypothetical protein Mapa_004461 [Marchantia paleacea]|nr:hypothetical protein Mapa_004461 [Marchantia paleacea]
MKFVDEKQVGRAVDSLLTWVKSQNGRDKAQLLEDEQLLYVVVTLNKVPEQANITRHRIPLPNSLHPLDGAQEICLFVKDGRLGGLSKKEVKAKLLAEGLTNVTRVIDAEKLSKNYGTHEGKRKLCGSYDLFLCDDRIYAKMPKYLGKIFWKKKKWPLSVNLTRLQWRGQITAACNSTEFELGRGSCSVVKAARVSQSRDEILSNLKAIIEGVASHTPRKWGGIQALYLKSVDSVALPIYQAFPEQPMKLDGF